MRRSALVCAILILSVLGTAAARTGDELRSLHGVVTDESGGVLPGVTVEAASADGRVVATTVTDAVGRYVFSSVPVAALRLTFQLEAFSPAALEVDAAAADAAVAV